MKNKYLLSLLAALGFSGCGNNNEIGTNLVIMVPVPSGLLTL